MPIQPSSQPISHPFFHLYFSYCDEQQENGGDNPRCNIRYLIFTCVSICDVKYIAGTLPVPRIYSCSTSKPYRIRWAPHIPAMIICEICSLVCCDKDNRNDCPPIMHKKDMRHSHEGNDDVLLWAKSHKTAT